LIPTKNYCHQRQIFLEARNIFIFIFIFIYIFIFIFIFIYIDFLYLFYFNFLEFIIDLDMASVFMVKTSDNIPDVQLFDGLALNKDKVSENRYTLATTNPQTVGSVSFYWSQVVYNSTANTTPYKSNTLNTLGSKLTFSFSFFFLSFLFFLFFFFFNKKNSNLEYEILGTGLTSLNVGVYSDQNALGTLNLYTYSITLMTSTQICQNNLCQNGNCNAGLYSYTCSCNTGYVGTYCQVNPTNNIYFYFTMNSEGMSSPAGVKGSLKSPAYLSSGLVIFRFFFSKKVSNNDSNKDK